MNQENKTALLSELDPYADFVTELESQSAMDYSVRAQELMEYTDMIISGLRLRVLAEPFCLLTDMTRLKLTCGELICRLLRLKADHYALSDDSMERYVPKVEWSISITIATVQLENLYTFYNSHNIMAGELGGM